MSRLRTTFDAIIANNLSLAKFNRMNYPVKRSCKILQEKILFLAPLQDLARDPVGSCGILWGFAGILQEFCARILQDSYKIPQDPEKSHRILQDLARSCWGARKRTFSSKILQERFYWVVLGPVHAN